LEILSVIGLLIILLAITILEGRISALLKQLKKISGEETYEQEKLTANMSAVIATVLFFISVILILIG